MTYNQIQIIYKTRYGKTVKSCWIADIKRELKLTKRQAYNRINDTTVKHPCPKGLIKERLTEIIKTCYNTV